MAAGAFGFLLLFSEGLACALRIGRVILVGLVGLTPHQVLVESPTGSNPERRHCFSCVMKEEAKAQEASPSQGPVIASGRPGTCAQSVSPYP